MMRFATLIVIVVVGCHGSPSSTVDGNGSGSPPDAVNDCSGVSLGELTGTVAGQQFGVITSSTYDQHHDVEYGWIYHWNAGDGTHTLSVVNAPISFGISILVGPTSASARSGTVTADVMLGCAITRIHGDFGTDGTLDGWIRPQ
jgi:hypothetical protein